MDEVGVEGRQDPHVADRRVVPVGRGRILVARLADPGVERQLDVPEGGRLGADPGVDRIARRRRHGDRLVARRPALRDRCGEEERDDRHGAARAQTRSDGGDAARGDRRRPEDREIQEAPRRAERVVAGEEEERGVRAAHLAETERQRDGRAEGEREAPEREHEQRAECGAVAGGEVVPEDDAREPERGERDERDVAGQHAWAERDERVERDRARRAELALEVVVREQKGQDGERGRGFGEEERGPAARVAPQRETAEPPEVGEGEEGKEEGGEVDAGEALEREARPGEQRRAHAVPGERAPRQEEEERQPPRDQHLHLAAFEVETERREPVEDARDQRARGAAGERTGEGEQRERVERRRGDGREVVHEERIGGQEPEWREREGETEQVIRVEERAGVRVEDVGVEEPARPRDERVLVPGERPGVQEAVVPGYALEVDVVPEAGQQRPLGHDGEGGVQQAGSEERATPHRLTSRAR